MFLTEAGAVVAEKAFKVGATKLYEERAQVKSLLSSAWKRISDGKTVVVISGLGGAGKSTIQKILSGEKSVTELSPEYQLSVDNEPTHVKDKYFVGLYTRPGQPDGLDYNKSQLIKELGKAKKIIFISVVTYGYNALYNVEPTKVPGYKPENNVAETAAAYLGIRRNEEIERLREFCGVLKGLAVPKKIEILTVVNKLDMWWDDRDLVLEHYTTSEYNNIIQDLISAKSSSFARHTLVSVSLLISNIRMSDDKELLCHSSNFDVVRLQRNFHNFVDVIHRFLKSV